MLTVIVAAPLWANKAPAISGDYLEVRTCNVYVGGCIANGEMGITGKEAILVWSVRDGSWHGTKLDGLKVLAVVSADDTLGDLRYNPVVGKAQLIVDHRASAAQREALADLARSLGGKLVSKVVETRVADIDVTLDASPGSPAASVRAGNLVEIETQSLTGKKTVCASETKFYPPLTEVSDAQAGYTAMAAYKGTSLDRKWESVGLFSSYVGTFSR
jgi:hypothetical protein